MSPTTSHSFAFSTATNTTYRTTNEVVVTFYGRVTVPTTTSSRRSPPLAVCLLPVTATLVSSSQRRTKVTPGTGVVWDGVSLVCSRLSSGNPCTTGTSRPPTSTGVSLVSGNYGCVS